MDWSGIIAVILLVIGLLQDLADPSALTIVILSGAALTYFLCWYNFETVVRNFKGLSPKPAFAISAVGLVGTFAALASVGVSVTAGLLFLGLAMIGVAWGILKSRLLPDGFAWLSGITGMTTILLGVTGDTSNVGTASMYFVLFWAVSMSIMFIGWGHLPDNVQED